MINTVSDDRLRSAVRTSRNFDCSSFHTSSLGMSYPWVKRLKDCHIGHCLIQEMLEAPKGTRGRLRAKTAGTTELVETGHKSRTTDCILYHSSSDWNRSNRID
jgi:hypothetical protein